MINDVGEWETKCTVEHQYLTVMLRCEGATIDQVLEAFYDALRGCGFEPTGKLVMEDDLCE